MAYGCLTCSHDRGGAGMRDDGNCVSCGPIKKKALAKKVDSLMDKLDGAQHSIEALTRERDALRRKLDAIAAIPEPTAPCPCKPLRWKDCECGAYRKGVFHMNQIDAYAAAMEVYEAVRAIVEGEA